MTKPIVQIKNAYFTTNGFSDTQRLAGVVLDYPDDHQGYPGCLTNGEPVITSQVIGTEVVTSEDYVAVVETARTLYHVLNWVQ